MNPFMKGFIPKLSREICNYKVHIRIREVMMADYEATGCVAHPYCTQTNSLINCHPYCQHVAFTIYSPNHFMFGEDYYPLLCLY